jgi:hypothetical protein
MDFVFMIWIFFIWIFFFWRMHAYVSLVVCDVHARIWIFSDG